MGAVVRLWDRLTNVMSGMGTTADRRTASFYTFVPMSGEQAEAGYRSSWLVRKIVDVPPFDMTREWRDWQAESADIEKIEAEEKRLQVKAKCLRALVLARLYGGAGLILGTGDQNTEEPLNPNRAVSGGLKYLHPLSRWQLTEGAQRLDPADPWFGQPEYFTINAGGGQQVKLHPSRVIAFIGQRVPEGGFYQSQSWFWGDPIMQSIGDAVQNADQAQSGFASLIDRAAVDVFKFKDLMKIVGTEEGEKNIKKRVAWANQAKSTHRAMLIDAEDDWEQVQVSWGGIPEAMLAFMDIVAGAADIPLTRLLGQSPRGLQSTGDGEERDYQSMIKARQNEQLAPALDRIDDLLIPSALGSRPSDVYWTFAPLGETNEKDQASIEASYAAAVQSYANSGVVPDTVLTAMVKGRSIESGNWPGAETAWEEAEANPEADNGDESDLTTLEQRIAAMEKRGTVTADQALTLIRDARPRSLYVNRKLLNATDVIAWAKGQGIETTLPADKMHVTVLYSREPVDWMAMGQAWDQDNDGKLRVAPGGPRMVEQFGDLKTATVLLFNSSSLAWRHMDMVQKGASHDFDEYAPHITLTWQAPADLDLDSIEPYTGELVFGPEIFEEVNESWSASLTEDGGSPQGPVPFGDARKRRPRRGGRSPHGGAHFDPSQPRDFNGRWTDTGALNFVREARSEAKMVAYQLGEADEHMARQLKMMGIPYRKRWVKLDQSRVSHILLAHGPGSADRNPVTHNEIANVHQILAAARFTKGSPFQTRGIYRVTAHADLGGQKYGVVAEVRRHAIVPLTMYHRGEE